MLLPLFDSKRPSWEKWVRSRNILAISKNIYTAHFIIWNRNYTFWKNINTTIRKIPKEILRQILTLAQNTPDCDVYILTGFISIEKQIEKKALIFFNNICNQHEESIEKRLARRQLSTKKNKNSNSWFMNLKILLLKYNQDDPLDLLDNPRKKEEWKLNVIKQINQSWKEHILHCEII